MSLQEELEEVIRWVADLTAEEPSAATEPLSREDWGRIQDGVERVSEKLADARLALESAPAQERVPSALVELADDLTHQSEDLALRARMLKQRAKPDSPQRRAAKASAREEVQKERDEKERAEEESEGTREPVAPPTAPPAEREVPRQRPTKATKPQLEQAIDFLNVAQRSLGTTHEHLHVVTQLDFAATSFLGELEVLAEMTLTLTQQCERCLHSPARAN